MNEIVGVHDRGHGRHGADDRLGPCVSPWLMKYADAEVLPMVFEMVASRYRRQSTVSTR